jgi:uncharacterized protein (DUF433 family)
VADGTPPFDRITVDPQRMNGQPCVRELRLTVRRVLELLAVYEDRSELKSEFPELDDEDIRQVLRSCADDLVAGALISVEAQRTRVRQLPIRSRD